MIKLSNLPHSVRKYLNDWHEKVISRPFEGEYAYKIEEITKKLVKITSTFNYLVISCPQDNYYDLCSVFRLHVPIYDRELQMLRFKGYRCMINKTIYPNSQNVGINNPEKVFNYIINIPDVDNTGFIRSYLKKLKKLNEISNQCDLSIKTLEYLNEHMSNFRIVELLTLNLDFRIGDYKIIQDGLPHLADDISQLVIRNVSSHRIYYKKIKGEI